MKAAATIRAAGTGTRAALAGALLLVLFLAAAAEASGPAGTVAARETELNLSPVGVGYYHRSLRMDPRGDNFRSTVFRQDQYFVDLAGEKYGWSVYARGGVATLSDDDGGGRFDEGHRPFVGAGLRYHAPISGDGATLFVGTARFSWTFPFRGEDRITPSAPVPDRARVKDFWSGDLTFALQRRFGTLALFAGPAVQYARLKAERTEAGVVRVESMYDTASNLLGAVGGFRVDLGKVALQAEAQAFETTSYGATLSYGF